ncbi:MAG: HpcH/HpaI aldolase family protein [Leadbetterella sp.]
MSSFIKSRIAQGEHLANAWIIIPNSWTMELVGLAGYDVLTIDAQHGLASDLSTILPMLQALKHTGASPFVRIPQNDPAYIMRMLDAGVKGLICPMINTAEDTERFVQAAKYYPDGFRSFGPTRAAALHGDGFFAQANQDTITMAMIETPAALENIEAIVKTPNLDGLYVGPWDLSISLGYKKHADFDDPSFWDIMKHISDTARAAGLFVGIHAGNPRNALRFKEIGYQFLTMFSDSNALRSIADSTLDEFKEGVSHSKISGY